MEPYVKEISFPCNRKCPCRLWMQCSIYNDKKKREEMLKNKKYDFHAWYENSMKNDCCMHDLYVNG